VVQPTEVADDRRQRGRDDGLIERGQQHHHQQGSDDQADSWLTAALLAHPLLDSIQDDERSAEPAASELIWASRDQAWRPPRRNSSRFVRRITTTGRGPHEIPGAGGM
jgi:hypothetical protein